MQLSALLPAPLPRTRLPRARRLDTAPTHAPTVNAARARAKRSGGPTDSAMYWCGCGYRFTAEVSTSVPCPHCGTTQAW